MLFPRSKRIICYGGAMDMFVDNCKHQFLINIEEMPLYKHVWLTRNPSFCKKMRAKGLPCYISSSAVGIFYSLRAGYFIFDDALCRFMNPDLSSGSVHINLWHGIPAKSITGNSIIPSKPKDTICGIFHRLRWGYLRGDYGLVTSSKLVPLFTHFYNLPESRIIIGGYPRNRAFFTDDTNLIMKYEDNSLIQLHTRLSQSKMRKVIYMPTFRDGNKNYLNQAIPNWELLNEVCVKNNIEFYVKVHRVTTVPEGIQLSNVHFLSRSLDIYPILKDFDLLITDYSSIMFDFALMRKDILLYTYDIQDYIKRSRDVYPTFLELLHSLTSVECFDSLLKYISDKKSIYNAFPISDYFDCADNFKNIQKLITQEVF